MYFSCRHSENAFFLKKSGSEVTTNTRCPGRVRVRSSCNIAFPYPLPRNSGCTIKDRISAMRREYRSKQPHATMLRFTLMIRQKESFFRISDFVLGIRCSASEFTSISIWETSLGFGLSTLMWCIIDDKAIIARSVWGLQRLMNQLRHVAPQLHGIIRASVVGIGHVKICDEKVGV